VEVAQRFTVAGSPDEVWALLSDVRAVAQCVPGLELLGEGPDGVYLGRFAVKVGPVSAKVEGEGRLAQDDGRRSATIEGKGVDKRGGSRVKGLMRYAVVPDGAGSAIEIKADMTLSGPLAQVGRTAIIEDVARALTREFSAKLEERLASRGDARQSAVAGVAPAAAGASPAAREFNAGRAMSRAYWIRIVGWIRRLFGRSDPGI
jgi:carbon monoxide dehydrogenase subunit G